MYGGIFELWECGCCDGGGDDEGVGDVEEFGSGGEGDGGATVAVGFGEEEEGGGDGCPVGTGPGDEVAVFGSRCPSG